MSRYCAASCASRGCRRCISGLWLFLLFLEGVGVRMCMGGGGGPPLGYTVPPERTRPALGAKEGTGGARRRGRPTDAGRAFFFFFSSFARRGRGGRVVEGTLFFFFFGFPTKRDCGVFPVLAQKGSSGVLTRNARGFFFRFFFFLMGDLFRASRISEDGRRKGRKKKRRESLNGALRTVLLGFRAAGQAR